MDFTGLGLFLLVLLGLLIILLIRSLIGREFCSAAEDKGYSSSKYLWWILLTGIPGMLLVIALPDRNSPDYRNTIRDTVTETSPSALNISGNQKKTPDARVNPDSSRHQVLEAQDLNSLPRF